MDVGAKGDMVLGSQAVARVLVISSDSDQRLSAAQAIHQLLSASNHQVSLVGPTTWRDSLAVTAPEIVLLDTPANGQNTNFQQIAALCSEVKDAPGCEGVPVAVVLPAEQTVAPSQAWEILQAACVDDLWRADAGKAELQVRVELLARVARLSRDLASVRGQLSKHLQTDEATQLLTRRFFFQAAFREVSRARRYGHHLSCLMIDVDFIENINRKFGDACGDYVLRSVAQVVRQWTRDSDTVARFSDHKFVALLPETTIENATRVREKIVAAMNETKFEWHGHALPVSVSIGEAECSPVDTFGSKAPSPAEVEDEDPESHSYSVREELAALLEDADAALNVAKKTARRPEIFVEYSPGTVGLPGSE